MQPNAEMSYCQATFDLKAAREICIKLDLRYPARSLVDIDYQCALAAEMLPAALDEIERQANRIAELEGKLKTATQYDDLHIEKYNCAMRKISKLHAALKKLGNAKRERGKALVEERAECNAVRIALGHPIAYAGFGNKERMVAREQLRREGKI